MATEIIMPVLGLTMESGVIVEWLKHEGDAVTAGEILFTVETDKSVMEVEAKVSGVLLKILHGVGDSVPIQQTIGYIGVAGEAVSAAAGGGGQPEPVAAVTSQDVAPVVASSDGDRVKISPAARNLAKELGVALDQVTGTGPGGRIVREDIERHAATQTAPPVAAPAPPVHAPVVPAASAPRAGKRERSRTPLTGKRKIAAKRLTESTTTVPHFFVTMDIDMTKAVELREALIQRGEADGLPRVSFTDILVKAVGIALREMPMMNASLDGETIIQYEDVNVGVAVALDDGLVVPVVSHADQLSVYEIAKSTQALEARAKSKGLGPDDYGHGTFTISNLGMFGVDHFTAIINPPESAILAVGRIKKAPVVLNDAIVVRSMLTMTLSSDHRVIDGAVAARFMARLRRILEQPLELLIHA